MDNFTHTLVGVAIGHLFARKEREDAKAQVFVAAIASNAPDIDVALQPLLGGGRIGYMLHHRGYTHTLLALIPLALLSAWAGSRLAGKQSPGVRALLPAALIGGLLHIAADGCNDYGIHPFSPFWNRWFHGDTIFIVEPLIIYALLPLAILRASSAVTRGVWLTFGGLLLGAAFLLPQIRLPVAIWVLAWAAGMALGQRKLPALPVAIGAVASVLLTFATGNRLAHRQVLASAPEGARTLDVALTPAPANPACFRALWVATEGEDYVVRKGALSLAPSLVDPNGCSFGRVGEGTAPLSPVQQTDPSLRWEGEFRAPLSELRSLATQDCRVRDALRFWRVPFWTHTPEGLLIGDLRYDNEKELGFSELLIANDQIGSSEGCFTLVPPWEPPLSRAGLDLATR